MSVTDHRGLGKRLKASAPVGLFRLATRLYNCVMSYVPFRVKYRISVALRRRKAPYSFLRNGDDVVQIGAPRDILLAGRSRAVNFALLVGTGRVLVAEPDRANIRELREL